MMIKTTARRLFLSVALYMLRIGIVSAQTYNISDYGEAKKSGIVLVNGRQMPVNYERSALKVKYKY